MCVCVLHQPFVTFRCAALHQSRQSATCRKNNILNLHVSHVVLSAPTAVPIATHGQTQETHHLHHEASCRHLVHIFGYSASHQQRHLLTFIAQHNWHQVEVCACVCQLCGRLELPRCTSTTHQSITSRRYVALLSLLRLVLPLWVLAGSISIFGCPFLFILSWRKMHI